MTAVWPGAERSDIPWARTHSSVTSSGRTAGPEQGRPGPGRERVWLHAEERPSAVIMRSGPFLLPQRHKVRDLALQVWPVGLLGLRGLPSPPVRTQALQEGATPAPDPGVRTEGDGGLGWGRPSLNLSAAAECKRKKMPHGAKTHFSSICTHNSEPCAVCDAVRATWGRRGLVSRGRVGLGCEPAPCPELKAMQRPRRAVPRPP